MMHLFSKLCLPASVAILIASLLTGCRENEDLAMTQIDDAEVLQRFEFQHAAMGVEFGLILYATDQATADKAASSAFELVDDLNTALSNYKRESEVNQLCKSAPHDEVQSISDELRLAVECSRHFFDLTDGAFDISIGPASHEWRMARRRNRMPTNLKIENALGRMGMEHVKLSLDGLQLSRAEMQLDFGGIGKGLAADMIVRQLKQNGIDRALVDASGDIVVSDPPPGEEGWTVKMPSAQSEEGGKAEGKAEEPLLTLSNQAVASSGDVYQYVEFDGQRYSHIVDPVTAIAVSTPRIVTVIAESGAAADALASAISVRGREGFVWQSEEAFEARIIEAVDGDLKEFEIQETNGFKAYAAVEKSNKADKR